MGHFLRHKYFTETRLWMINANECLITPSGEEYTGHLNHTLSGLPCQRWSSQWPHRHAYDDIKYFADYRKNSEAVIHDVDNYCRNPSVASSTDVRPWCFTTNENVTKEYCDIPKCKGKHVFCVLISRSPIIFYILKYG